MAKLIDIQAEKDCLAVLHTRKENVVYRTPHEKLYSQSNVPNPKGSGGQPLIHNKEGEETEESALQRLRRLETQQPIRV